MSGSKRRMIRAQRRLYHAQSTFRTPAPIPPAFTAMADAYTKWIEHRSTVPLHDVCPSCAALVVVTCKHDESDISHAMPVCDDWYTFAIGMGAHSPTILEREVE